MKKYILSTVLILCIVFTITACESRSKQTAEPSDILDEPTVETSLPEEASPPEKTNTVTYELDKMPDAPNINAAPVADLTDLYALTEVYVWPLTVNGGVWAQSWSTPSEIPADQLIYICAFNLWVEYNHDNDAVQPFASAEEVEAALQKYFDVTSEYLRTASSYNTENNTYPLIEGGGGWAAVAMSAKQEGNQVIIQVGSLPPDETVATEMGILTLEQTEGSGVRYLSYEFTGDN